MSRVHLTRLERERIAEACAENEALEIRAWLATQDRELVAAIVEHVVDDVLQWDHSADSEIAADEARRWLRDRLPALLAPVRGVDPNRRVSPERGSGGTLSRKETT